jgi:hypothetical protein
MYSESVLGFSSGGCATSEQKSYLYKTERLRYKKQKGSVNLKHEIDRVFLCDPRRGDDRMTRTSSRKITPKTLWYQMNGVSLQVNNE